MMINLIKYLDEHLNNNIKSFIPIILFNILFICVLIYNLPIYIIISIGIIMNFFIYFFNKYILSKEHMKEKELIKSMEVYKNNNKILVSEKEKLIEELEKSFKEFDKRVISSKTDLFGIITYASEAFCEISGYKEEEMIGKPHNLVRHKDTPKETFKEMWKTLEKDKIWAGDIKNIKKDGGFYWVRSVISPIYDEYGVKIGYNSIRHDITKDKEN